MRFRDRLRKLVGGGGPEPLAPWIRVILVMLVLMLGMALGRFAQENEVVRGIVSHYGYVGVFIIALVSGFNIVVPVPAIAFTPLFVASGLQLAPVILVIVLGVTTADMLAFSLGHAGADLDVVKSSRVVRKLRALREKHYWKPLGAMFLYACFAPLPNEVMAIPLGLMKYPAHHIFVPLLLGNLVFNTLASLAVLSVFERL